MNVGDRAGRTVVEDLTRTQIVQYAAASGDFMPMHHDEEFARGRGWETVFAHGMLTMGLSGRVLEDLVRVDQVLRFSARMLAVVWPGDTLYAEAEVIGIDGDVAEIHLRTTNQDDVLVLDGRASVRIDA